MYGVSKITSVDDVMMISYSDVEARFMAETLDSLAKAGIVVDMICQTAPKGKTISFSFTSSFSHFDETIKALGKEERESRPMVSGGYSKINLFGQEMVESVGVAARALDALNKDNIEISMITTSDLDISLLVRQEDADVAIGILEKAYEI